MSVSQKSLVVTFAAILGGAAVIMACSSDDDAPGNGTTSSGGSSSSSSSSSSGSSGTTDDDDDAGDAGTEPPVEAGSEGGSGDKALGESCTDGPECASGVCYGGGSGGGGGSGNFCTTTCTMKGQDNDPACADPALSGKCNNNGFCQKAKN